MTIKKIITVDAIQDSRSPVGNPVHFSEYMKSTDISVNQTASRRFRELFPDFSHYAIEKISVEIIDEDETSGRETVITRFYV